MVYYYHFSWTSVKTTDVTCSFQNLITVCISICIITTTLYSNRYIVHSSIYVHYQLVNRSRSEEIDYYLYINITYQEKRLLQTFIC